MFITWSNFFFIIIWGGICDVWRIDKNIEDLTINGIRKVIGNGKSTCFWEDTWIGDKSLRVQFSRLYSMSLQQRTTIDECGIRDGALWLWNLQWRWEFFQWELQLVVALQNLLDQVTIVEDLQDVSSGVITAQDAFRLRLSIISTMTLKCISSNMIPQSAKYGMDYVLQKLNYWCGYSCWEESIQKIDSKGLMCCKIMT